MTKLDKFISNAQKFIGKDNEEKLLQEKYNNEIRPIMLKISDGLRGLNPAKYQMFAPFHMTELKIDDIKFEMSINNIENQIDIKKILRGEEYVLEQIVLKNNNLFFVNKQQEFHEDILVEYLNEVFGEKLGSN